jgi:DNA-binding SARP family transcriptional activator/tetratricopeptide (TPR) repeat protein
VEVRVLGTVEVQVGDSTLNLAKRQHRLILGILSLEPNRPIRIDRLIDLLWGDDPPQQARSVIYSRISELRAALNKANGTATEGGQLLTVGSSYLLQIAPELVDAHKFRMLLATARGSGSDERVRTLLRQALGLWRGPVLGGWLPAAAHGAVCHGLESARLTAAEDLFEAELRLHRHEAVVDELVDLSAANPSRERLTAAVMLALHRTGRTAEAIRAYDRTRRWLDRELGIDPGKPLTALYLSLLRGAQPASPHSSPEATAEAGPDRPGAVVPQTLPSDIPDFTGRDAETSRLVDLLTAGGGTVAVAAIAGPAGVGKTTLSVHVAHRLRPRFPDGQLFADLRGIEEDDPVEPANVLGRFLRALGVDGLAVPETLEDRVDLYRALLAGRQVLVLLDNVESAGQVLPLIPGSPGCAVLINSRVRLGAIIGATMVNLDVLAAGEAVSLLSRIAGRDRIGAEPEAAATLAQMCGHLPLAVRVAAANLATKPHWTVHKVVGQLADERARLDHLAHGQLDVRPSIALSLAGLTADAHCLLRRLGHLNLPEVNPWVSAALLDVEPAAAEDVLEQLYDAQLVAVDGRDVAGHPRYRLHDLVRLLARERAGSDEAPEDLSAALGRAFGSWLYLVDTAHRAVHGGDYLRVRGPAPRWRVDDGLVDVLTAQPLRWFESERLTIAAVTRRAAEAGDSDVCWDLACTTPLLFKMLGDYDTWPGLLAEAQTETRRAGNERGRAAALHGMGTLCVERCDYEGAWSLFQSAAELFDRHDDRHGHALATLYAAMADRFRNRPDAAVSGFRRALAGMRDHGDRGGEALALRGIGQTYLQVGDYPTADEYLAQALDVTRRAQVRRSEAQVLFWQGMLRLKQGRYLEAERLFKTVLGLTRALPDAPGVVQALRGLGLCHIGQGASAQGRAELLAALRRVERQSSHLEAAIRQDLEALAEPLPA